MESELVPGNSERLAIRNLGLERPDAVHVVWGHGWGQSGTAMLPLAESLAGFVSSTILDFPGFGGSPMPPATWGTADFADHIAAWLREQSPRRRFWAGHSFGGRVGIQIAARHPDLLDGLILIASAGLKRKRTFYDQTRYLLRRNLFNIAKRVFRNGPVLERMRSRFGSFDYRNAGQLRPILTNVVNEDLTAVASAVLCPTLLLYGEADTETPVEMGQRFHSIIRNSTLVLLHGADHYSILGDGRHQTARHILSFLRGGVQ